MYDATNLFDGDALPRLSFARHCALAELHN